MKLQTKLMIGIVVGVFAAYYTGLMFGFRMFLSNDSAIRAIGFSTLVICVVVGICTCIIISEINKK